MVIYGKYKLTRAAAAREFTLVERRKIVSLVCEQFSN